MLANGRLSRALSGPHKRSAFFRRRVPLYVSVPIVIACGATGTFVGNMHPQSPLTGGSESRLFLDLPNNTLAVSVPSLPVPKKGTPAADALKSEAAGQALALMELSTAAAPRSPSISASNAHMPTLTVNGGGDPTVAGRSFPPQQHLEARSRQPALSVNRNPAAKQSNARVARHEELDTTALANALFVRGRSYAAKEQYIEAIADLREAGRLGHVKAANVLWWVTNRRGDQLRAQGKAVEGLLITWTNLLDLTPQVRETLELRELKSNESYWLGIGALYADLKIALSPSEVSECDILADLPLDPFRVAKGVPFVAIDAPRAIAACDRAIKDHPEEARFLYQRARAYSRAARVASAAEDWSSAHANDATAIADLRAAMAMGYPLAFNNMAHALLAGEGTAPDAAKAADLFMETLNRTIHCCWTLVARHLLDVESKHDAAAVRRVVRELTSWAAALGSSPARNLLSELTTKGTIDPIDIPAAVTFTATPPWFRR
jgi:tetratricopeptide (TPR) repeat protein